MSSAIYWEAVCGRNSLQDAFWSEEISVNTTNPDFTQCFQDTVLVWGCCGFLWLCCIFYIPYLAKCPTVNTWSRVSRFNNAKVFFSVVVALVSVVDLVKTVLDYNDQTSPSPPVSMWIKPILYTATFIFAAFIIHYEFRKGEHSGGVIFTFWALLLIVNIVPFRSYIQGITYNDEGKPVIPDVYRFVTFYVFFAFLVLEFLLHCFVDLAAIPDHVGRRQIRWAEETTPLLFENPPENVQASKAPTCPEGTSHFVSRALFFWITRLMITGYRRDLVFDDMWELMSNNKCKNVTPRFEEEWKKELETTDFKLLRKERVEEERRGISIPEGLGGSKKGASTYHDTPYRRLDQEKKKKLPSVWFAICRAFGGYYMIGGIYKLLYDLITFVNPQILDLLITYVGTATPFAWQGYLYAVILFVIAMTRTIILQQYWDICFVTGLRLRTAIIGSVYRKSLKLTSKARQSSSVGEIVNLMSVDAQKFQDAPAYMHMVWSTPITIGVAVYFLWQQLGPSVLAGLGIMLLLIPINGFIAQKSRKLQIQQMKFKDDRIKLMNEILNGVKVLKLYAWEDSFEDRVSAIREQELKVLKAAQYLSAVSSISWFMAPYLVALATFGVFVLSSPTNILDPNKAFVSLSLFNILNYPMSILPAVISFGVQGAVSIGRISKFLKNEEIDPDNISHDPSAANAIEMEDASFSWEGLGSPTLKNLSMKVPDGKLVAVVGNVGSGKSSLLSAMLGEMEVLKGRTNVRGKVAYVPQQAWIQNATLRDNILFGERYQKHKYDGVVEASALAPDLEILPGGDQTEIGEKGINLSGGQKQRVSLARAVYQNADVYLLDDPLSAVDSHVGKHIFEQIIGPGGMLSNKTRILVTNGIAYLSKMDFIVVLKNGEVSELGGFQELINHNGAFAEFINTYLNEADEDEEDANPEVVELKNELRRRISVISESQIDESPEKVSPSKSVTQSSITGSDSARARRRKFSRAGSRVDDKETILKEKERDDARKKNQKLIEKESAMTGNVKLSVFMAYVRACGTGTFIMCLLWYLLYLASQVATNIWLSLWSTDQPTINGTQDTELRDLRLGVYGGLGIVQAVGVLGQSFSIAVMCISASRVLHHELMSNILRAPMSFFDTTPLGRIVNRFSRDVDTVDINMPMTLRIWMGTFAGVITTIVVISYSTPIFLVIIIPLGIFYYFVQRFYISTSRQLKRIESIVRSPIFAHFGETVTGISSIRAYGKQNNFIERSSSYVDGNQMVYYPTIVSNRWLGLWLEFIGNLIVLFAALFAVIEKDSINPGLAGLSVSYALQVTGALNMVVRMTSDLETYVVAVERIKEYADCPKEAPAVIDNNRPPRSWPDSGAVVMTDYATRYRDGLDLVLKEINCSINPGEKVGIVGRTGAGKSSLTLALFRIIEAAMGHITIDNVNISNIGLKDLRSKITIIPQDPVLFSGTLRMNLDPFETHPDDELWDGLKQAHLSEFVGGLAAGLLHECTEGGENLSVGQRQLVCLARALLRKTKILVLDEATAAIDLETDDLIQATIRTEFRECTVITIAHRLNTIMDYDRVIVLDKGTIVEFDHPNTLKQDSKTIFYGMVKDAGLL